MNKYEVMYLIHQSVEDEPRKELIERFNNLITTNGGEVEKIDEWGKRRLAYPIDDMNEAYYVLLHMNAAPEFPKELERNFEISDYVIRYLITRLDA